MTIKGSRNTAPYTELSHFEDGLKIKEYISCYNFRTFLKNQMLLNTLAKYINICICDCCGCRELYRRLVRSDIPFLSVLDHFKRSRGTKS